MPYDTLKLASSASVLSWANHDLSYDEIRMAKNVASLPFIFKHISLMPDVHLGKGALVGSVIATKDAIVPAAVGVDIGCGMAAVKTPFTGDHLDSMFYLTRIVRILLKGRRNLRPTGVICSGHSSMRCTTVK